MNRTLPRPITREEIDTYNRDGVVMLSGMFDADWIDTLQAGLARNRNEPTHRTRIYDRDEKGRAFFYDSQAWQRIPEYQEFVFNSPCAEIAGRLMQSNRINFYFDAVFVRDPGTQFATPWHQDEPYWSVDGFQTCSIWMPLVPVTKQSALAFVPGSHRWNKLRQDDWSVLNPDGQTDVATVNFNDAEGDPFPDINADPEGYGVTSWAMQPGDCVAFNGRLIHGGSGGLAEDRDLRVFNTKWLGDDVRIIDRPTGMDPDHIPIMREHGLMPGDRVGTDLYPELWVREREIA